jgi:hypothetical protein
MMSHKKAQKDLPQKSTKGAKIHFVFFVPFCG